MNQWQRAFVIHSRLYSESSLLLDLFTEHHGRVTVLAKGVRRKKSPQKGHLQLFTPLIVQYSGKGSVKTLRQVESLSLALPLYRTALYSAFYLNELLQRTVVTDSDTGELFLAYVEALQLLASGQRSPEYALRRFELALLQYLGYSVDFLHCYGSAEPVVDEMTYQYRSEKGFIASLIEDHHSFRGAELKALAVREFPDKASLQAAKRFTRMALKPYIGSQPFKSRELFRKN